MTRTALIFEIEELLFDTLGLRARALQQALADEGVTATYDDVARAQTGRPTALAIGRITAAEHLDDVGRDLVIRRAADAVAASMARGAPSFDPRARDALAAAAAEFPLAVVTCATRDDAQHLLELAGLDTCVTTIRSLAAAAPGEQHIAWADAQRRLHAARGVAFAPGPLLLGARRAGLTTVQVGNGTADETDARLLSLAHIDASFITSLLRTP